MNPIFIVGAPRSGTSMLHWALAQHPNLWGSAESDFLSTVIDGVNQAFQNGTQYGEHHWLVKEDVSRPEFLRFIGEGLNAMYQSRSGGLRWIEQTPHYLLHYSSLEAMFPGAKFIHITRDGRHTVNSMQEKFGWSFIKSMKNWRQLVEAGQAIKQSNRENFLQIKYESVIRNPEKNIRKLFDFIKESYVPEAVEFMQKPINASPGREHEAPIDKLDPLRLNWGFPKSVLFRLYCGKIQNSLEYE
jgi:hypothetical protein